MLSTKPFREIVKFVRENAIFGRENEKIVRERGFAWERRSQAPGFFPHLVWSDKNLKLAGIGNPKKLIENLVDGKFKCEVSNNVKIAAARRLNVSRKE